MALEVVRVAEVREFFKYALYLSGHRADADAHVASHTLHHAAFAKAAVDFLLLRAQPLRYGAHRLGKGQHPHNPRAAVADGGRAQVYEYLTPLVVHVLELPAPATLLASGFNDLADLIARTAGTNQHFRGAAQNAGSRATVEAFEGRINVDEEVMLRISDAGRLMGKCSEVFGGGQLNGNGTVIRSGDGIVINQGLSLPEGWDKYCPGGNYF